MVSHVGRLLFFFFVFVLIFTKGDESKRYNQIVVGGTCTIYDRLPAYMHVITIDGEKDIGVKYS